jgi:hypothetical protein
LEFGGGEGGVEFEAGEGVEGGFAAGGAVAGAEGVGAAALPDDGGVEGASGAAFKDDEGFALVGEAEAGDFVAGARGGGGGGVAGGEGAEGGEGVGPDFLGVVFHPAGAGVVLAVGACLGVEAAAGGVEEVGFRGRGALVKG